MGNVSNRIAKISAIKYFCIIGMVCLYTTFILDENSIPKISIASIAGIGLPLFFWLSGYFYFNRYKMSGDSQVLSKVKKILIPYFIWQIVAILMYTFVQILGFSCKCSVPSSLYNVFDSVVLGKNNSPLWYLRIIFVMFMLSPALVEFMKIGVKTARCSILALFILNIILYRNIQYASVQYWLPMYLSGGFFAIYCPDYVMKRKTNAQVFFSFLTLIGAWAVLVYMQILGIGGVSYFKYVMWFFTPYLLINLSEKLGKDDHAIYESEFFLYCAHQPVIYCIEAIVRHIVTPQTQSECLMVYVLVAVATILVCNFMYFILNKTRKRTIINLLYGRW